MSYKESLNTSTAPQKILEILALIFISALVLLCIAPNIGIWDPWEAKTLLTARNIAQLGINNTSFWVPQLDSALVYKPYTILWPLIAIFKWFPNPPEYLLRLPNAIAAICIMILTFLLLKKTYKSSVAWASVLAFLTIPNFIFGAKIINAGMLQTAAISLPILTYTLALISKSKRECHAYQTLLAISLLFAWLSSGFFSLAFFFLTVLIFTLTTKSLSPLRPLTSGFFFVPFTISLFLAALTFNQYQQQVRYVLEERQPITLEQLNDSLENNLVETINVRKNSIIGSMKKYDFDETTPKITKKNNDFILTANHNPDINDYNILLTENTNESLRFQYLLKRQFDYTTLPPKILEKPPRANAFAKTMLFFSGVNLDENLNINSADLLSASKKFLRIFSYNLFPWIIFLPLLLMVLFLTPDSNIAISLELRQTIPNQIPITQKIALIWLILAIFALFFSILFTHNFYFLASVPIAIASAILLGSTNIWTRLNKITGLICAMILFAIACAVILSYNLSKIPFIFIEYILNNPQMKWPAHYNILSTEFTAFLIAFVLMAILSFFKPIERINRKLKSLAPVEAKTTPPKTSSLSYESISKSDIFTTRTILIQHFQQKLINIKRTLLSSHSQQWLIFLTTTSFALILLGIYTPTISKELSEKDLQLSFQNITNNQYPLYTLKDNNGPKCRTYKDCKQGYTCEKNQCIIDTSTFYALRFAQPLNLNELMTKFETEIPTYAIIPYDRLFEINQKRRTSYEPSKRENLALIDNSSSRLLLVTNELPPHTENLSNIENYIALHPLPPQFTTNISLNENIEVMGYDISTLTPKRNDAITLKIYFKVLNQNPDDDKLCVIFKNENNEYISDNFELNDLLPLSTWLPQDIMMNPITFKLDTQMPAANYTVSVAIQKAKDISPQNVHELLQIKINE